MTPRTRTTPSAPKTWADTAETWQRRAGPHDVTLKSGQKVTFRLLGLGELSLRGAIPTELQDLAALAFLNKAQGGLDAVTANRFLEAHARPDDTELADALQAHLRKSWELTKLLITEALVEPALTVEQIDAGVVPFEDLEEVALLIQGRTAFDSRGVRVGVEEIDVLARFREHHGCKPDCAACDATLGDLSSVHLGEL